MSATVARRYARALFEIAKDAGRVSEALEELRSVAQAYEASEEFRSMELNPSLHEEERRKIVEALAKKLRLGDDTKRAVGMLAERQRLSLLPELVPLVQEMADDHLGVVRVRVRSARKLSESYKSKLERTMQRTTGKKVIVAYEHDPDLIGGVVTEIRDRVVDGSIRGRLDQLAESLRAT